jgi:aspartate aminotransferase-like enzyme
MSDLQFKQAETAEEMEQIHRLNHRIFSEEVGQYGQRHDGRLIDKFHSRNRYFIATVDGEVVGMVSAHSGPEFSIASRLTDASVLKALRAPLEIRLLAIVPRFRRRSILSGLFWQIRNYARAHQYSDLIISGIVERLNMYEKLGFRAIGPAVPCGSAAFVPMRLSMESESGHFLIRERMYGARWQRTHATSLLPGPVVMSARVIEAFHREPISHRSQPFIDLYQEMRARLSELMGGMQPVVLCGSGTLANDAVAANLRNAFGDAEGLIIANGEFGERLIHQAECAGLNYRALRFRWGGPWNFSSIEAELEHGPAWIWVVHLETSTGVLNDLPRLIATAHHRLPIAADCVSSLGGVELSESSPRLFMASGVSGKALASYAGLAFVFLSNAAIDALSGKTICPSFDLVNAARRTGPVSTIPAPLVLAILEALREDYEGEAGCKNRYRHYDELGRWTRAQIRAAALGTLAEERCAAPTVTTFRLPSARFPRECLRAGFRIAHESEYLRSRQWGQIATMGNLDRQALEPLFASIQWTLSHSAE